MLRKLGLLTVASAALTACNIPVMETLNDGRDRALNMMGMTQPAAMMVYGEDDSETFLSGEMRRKLNGEVFFIVDGPEWGECEGLISERLEVVSINCENGYAFTDELRADSTQESGVMEFFGNANGQEYVAFIGWGGVATELALRNAFSEYVNKV